MLWWSRLVRPVRVLIISVVVFVLVVVGVTVWTAVSRSVTHQEDTLPSYGSGLVPACVDAGTAYTGATANGGPGPHPVEVIASGNDPQGNLQDLGGLKSSVGPAQWELLSGDQVQLVACARRGTTGAAVASCPYTHAGAGDLAEPTVYTMYAADYDITIYELRTHRQVAQLTLGGDDNTCPSSRVTIVRGNGSDQANTLYSQLSTTQLRAKLAPYLGE